ncbi:MAG: DUF4139 domain-containing protein [Synergistaceae bacterium]|nr:DUF4139 domain-containing protein [Synergistaceae bacterium]
MYGIFTRWSRALLICALLIICRRDVAAGSEISVRSVDFYPAGAKVTFQIEVRKPDIEVKKTDADGRFEFVLPGAFSQDGIRCLTREKLTSLKVEPAFRREPVPEALLLLEQKVNDATRAVRLLQGRRAALSQTMEMLQTPFPATGEKDEGKVRIDGGDLIEYIENAQELRHEIETELVEVGLNELKAQKKMNEAREDFEALRRELEGKKPASSSTILRVGGTTSEPAILTFEAWTSVAGWNVEYDMDLNSETGDIAAGMNALAWQRTGLDLDGECAFHTRQPSFAVSPPDVAPLTVGLRSKEIFMSRQNYAPLLDSSVMEMKAASLGEDAMPPPAPLDVTSTLADVTVKGRGRIDGDGSQSRITLGEFALKSVPVLISIPERNREAWIVASLDSVPASFLPGTAELAVDGAATGRTDIVGSTEGRMRVPFGMTARLTAKKEPFVGKMGSTWTGTGVLNDGYTLEITSTMETEREITIRDRIPVSTTDKVVPEVKKIDPEPTERDRENRLLWKMNIRPGETKKITVEYTLRYPGDEDLEYR